MTNDERDVRDAWVARFAAIVRDEEPTIDQAHALILARRAFPILQLMTPEIAVRPMLEVHRQGIKAAGDATDELLDRVRLETFR